jgi:hypothetical protein
LVWALVLQRHQKPTFRVQFPICLTAKKFEEAVRGGIIRGISRSGQTTIRRAQPYHCTEPADHPLAILHDLNNIDKHKLLLIVSSYNAIADKINFMGDKLKYGEIKIIPSDWSRRKIRAVEGGAELFRVQFARSVKMSMYTDLTSQIAFEKFGVRQDEPVVPSLVQLRDAVVQTLKLFDGEF